MSNPDAVTVPPPSFSISYWEPDEELRREIRDVDEPTDHVVTDVTVPASNCKAVPVVFAVNCEMTFDPEIEQFVTLGPNVTLLYVSEPPKKDIAVE